MQEVSPRPVTTGRLRVGADGLPRVGPGVGGRERPLLRDMGPPVPTIYRSRADAGAMPRALLFAAAWLGGRIAASTGGAGPGIHVIPPGFEFLLQPRLPRESAAVPEHQNSAYERNNHSQAEGPSGAASRMVVGMRHGRFRSLADPAVSNVCCDALLPSLCDANVFGTRHIGCRVKVHWRTRAPHCPGQKSHLTYRNIPIQRQTQ